MISNGIFSLPIDKDLAYSRAHHHMIVSLTVKGESKQ